MNNISNSCHHDYHKNRLKVHQKLSKKVLYDNKEFHSGLALGRFLKLETPGNIYYYIKKGIYKGKKLSYMSRG